MQYKNWGAEHLLNNRGFTSDLKRIVLFVIILTFVLLLFFTLRELLVANAQGVTNTFFGGLGFR